MDIKEYIASGVLETYAMGLASEQEAQVVECIAKAYPEVRERLIELDHDLIEITNKIKVEPSKDLKSKIWRQIQPGAKEIPLEPKTSTPTRKINYWPWAAAIALLLALPYFLIQNKNLQNTVNQVANEQQTTKEKLTNLEDNYAYLQQKDAVISHHLTQKIRLASTAEDKNLMGEVFWNSVQKQFVFVNNELPKAPEGKQYQFWAIVDGQPQNMGVMPVNKTTDYMHEISFQKVDAFAITLEEEGGKPSPNLEQLKAIGSIA